MNEQKLYIGILQLALLISTSQAETKFPKGFLGQYPENCSYTGPLSKGQPHGKGEMNCKTFALEGTFIKGLPSSQMKFVDKRYADEGFQICSMKGFERHGKCIGYNLQGERVLESFYKNNTIDPSRLAQFRHPQKLSISYEGNLKQIGDHSFRHGYGHQYDSFGHIQYKGDWAKGEKHGFGIAFDTMHFGVSGGSLIGEWERGKPKGFVKGVSRNHTYIGGYNDEGRNGYGSYQNHQNQTSIFGQFANDKLHGPAITFDQHITFAHYQKSRIDPNFPIVTMDKDNQHMTYTLKSPDTSRSEALDTGLDYLKKNGEVYVGEMRNQVPHGFGIVKNFETKTKIMGIFEHGKLIETIHEQSLP